MKKAVVSRQHRSSDAKWPKAEIATHCVALLVILAVAVVLRAWNLYYGIPEILHPDEPTILNPALRISQASGSDLDPQFFNYPALQIYLLALVFYLKGVLALGGTWAAPATLDPAIAVHAARWTTAAFGIATIIVVYGMAARHFSRRTAIAAGLILAITPLHVLDSHYANVDIPMTFWLVAACLGSLEYLNSGLKRFLLLAACCIGFAGATKYTALVSFMMIPTAVFLRSRRELVGFPWLRLMVFGGIVCGLAFLLGAPYTLLRFNDAWQAISYEQAHVRQGDWGFDLNPGGWPNYRFIYQLAAGFPFALGIPLYLAAIAGLVGRCKSPQQNWAVLAAAGLPIFAVVGGSNVVYLRYLVPLLPFLVMLAAQFSADVLSFSKLTMARIASLICVSLMLLYTTAFTVSQLGILEPQNANLASRWIEKNVPQGSRICVAARVWNLSIPVDRYRIEPFVAHTVFSRAPSGIAPCAVDSMIQGKDLPEWFVVNSWFETGFERGGLRRGEINAFFKTLGASSRSPYELQVRFESRYLNESFYERLDPYFKNQFESPDFSIYRRPPVQKER